MNKEEMDSLISQLKASGLDEEKIMETFYETFQQGKMDRKDLEACANYLGYELTDEFKNDETPDPILGGQEGLTKEMAEEAKENPEEALKNPAPKPEDEDEQVDEDKEWEEVQKKFKWQKRKETSSRAVNFP